MTRPFVEIEQHGAGRYAVQASSFAGPVRFELVLPDPVSYTHLDVYKRQPHRGRALSRSVNPPLDQGSSWCSSDQVYGRSQSAAAQVS